MKHCVCVLGFSLCNNMIPSYYLNVSLLCISQSFRGSSIRSDLLNKTTQKRAALLQAQSLSHYGVN